MISDDEQTEGPPLSGEWVRDHVRHVRERDAESEDRGLREQIDRMMRAAEEKQARFRLTVCEGGEHRERCGDIDEQACEFSAYPECPRRLEDKRRKEAVDRRAELKRYGISERVLKVVLDGNPVETEAVKLLRAAFARDEKICLVVLQGGVGCGKSCSAALWAIEHGARWITAKDLARTSTYDDDFRSVERARRLVIDDLGTEYADQKGFFLSNLDGLIDARYADELPTVITTNVSAAEFKSRYGERIADRIRGSGAWVEVGGGSLRVRK